MRILVYTKSRDTDAMLAYADKLRADGHDVHLRNARYFDGAPEPCDMVVLHWDSQPMSAVYRAAGAQVEVMFAPAEVETPADIPAPLRTADEGVRPTQAKRRGRRRKAA